jgi:iron-sulfur cluster assembly protein
MMTVTDSAARGLADLLREKGLSPVDQGLRLAVERGGCAGLQYSMTLSAPADTDEVIECGGVRVFVDAESGSYLHGCTLDFTDDLTGAGFRIVNPRAARSCGCGTSFEPADRGA